MSRFEDRDTAYKALSMKCLAVAVQGGHGDDWAAYIRAVPGRRHEDEWALVAQYGTKLDYRIAKVLFPSFDEKYQWRS